MAGKEERGVVGKRWGACGRAGWGGMWVERRGGREMSVGGVAGGEWGDWCRVERAVVGWVGHDG